MPQKQGKSVDAGAKAPVDPQPSRRAPGYSTSGQNAQVKDVGRQQRLAEARDVGQKALSDIQQDAKASPAFAQATSGASAKHVQSPYLPSNDMQRFATDLSYTTPPIDTPRFGAQPINEAGLREFRNNSSVLRGLAGDTPIPNPEQFSAIVRSVLTPGQGQQISPEFAKELSRLKQVRDNPAAKAKLKAAIEQFNRFNQPDTARDASTEPAAPRAARLQTPGVGAAAQPAPNRSGTLAAALSVFGSSLAATSAASGAQPSSSSLSTPDAVPEGLSPPPYDDNDRPPAYGVPSDAPPAYLSAAPGSAVVPTPGADAGHKESSILAASPPSSARSQALQDENPLSLDPKLITTDGPNLPWDAFIAKMKHDSFESLMIRLALRGEQQALTVACAMAVRDLGVKAAETKRDVEQFDSLAQTFTAAIMVKQKLRDYNDANLDQGNRLPPVNQDLDLWHFLTDDDAKRRSVKNHEINNLVKHASSLVQLGPEAHAERADVAQRHAFGQLSESELRRLEAQGPQGRGIAQKIRTEQDNLKVINGRAAGYVFLTRNQEAELRLLSARLIEASPEGQTAAGRRRIGELREAAAEFKANNSSGTIAKVIEGSDRTIMTMTAVKRIQHTWGSSMQNNIAEHDRLLGPHQVNVERVGAPAEMRHQADIERVNTGLEAQLMQVFSIATQIGFNTTSQHDKRMENHRSGVEAFTRQTNELWSARGPSVRVGGATSLFDRRSAIEREESGFGPNTSAAQRAALAKNKAQLERDERLEDDKMFFGRYASTVSSFSAATLAYRHRELSDWFGPQASQENMHRWLSVGPTPQELRGAPGLQNKNLNDREISRLVEYGKKFTHAVGGQAVPGKTALEPQLVEAGFINTTCKAQMVRHFSDRKKAIEASDSPDKGRLIQENEQSRVFFENFGPWRNQDSPRHDRVIDKTLRAFEEQERHNKSALMVSEGFRAGNKDPADVDHNLKEFYKRVVPQGEDALDHTSRVKHELECGKVLKNFMTEMSMPNHEQRRLEHFNASFVFVNGSQMFSSANELLMGHLDEDAGELEQLFSELTQSKQEDMESVNNMMETLNRSLGAFPGG